MTPPEKQRTQGEPVIRVLIADDHPIVRQGIVTVISRERDIEFVGEASNGREAVEMTESLQPDIVLMDLEMPEMKGHEAIAQIGAGTSGASVIILTTFDTDQHIFDGLEAGARGYLLKDSPPADLINAIRAVYRGESMIEPRVAGRLLDQFTRSARARGDDTFHESLSNRETEVVRLMASGATNKEIAAQLNIGESTVKTHVIHLFNKLGVKDRTGAVMAAARRGIVEI